MQEYDVVCPGCGRKVFSQPVSVVECRDAAFKCRFCDRKGIVYDNQGRSK